MRYPALATALWIGAVSVAVAADDLPVMVYPAPKAKAAPVLDGKLDDACWQQPPLVSGFTFHGEVSKVAGVQTAFRVTYDEAALYVAVICDEPLASKLKKAGPGSRDDHGAVFPQECIELFVDPFHDHANYYQIAMSVQETLYDGLQSDTTWNSHTRVATRIGDKQWFMEVAVPWADIGVKRLRPGMVVGFNVCRDRVLKDTEWTNWSPMTSGFHDAPLFGHVVLSPTTQMLGRLSAQFRKGERQGPIRIFSSAGFTGAAYLELGRGALAELDRVLAELDALCKKERPAVAKNLRQRLTDTRAAAKPIRDRLSADEPLNAAEWIRMDRTLVDLSRKAAQSLWEIRLKTLLEEI